MIRERNYLTIEEFEQPYYIIVPTPNRNYAVKSDDWTRTYSRRGLYNLLRNSPTVNVIGLVTREISDVIAEASIPLRRHK